MDSERLRTATLLPRFTLAGLPLLQGGATKAAMLNPTTQTAARTRVLWRSLCAWWWHTKAAVSPQRRTSLERILITIVQAVAK